MDKQRFIELAREAGFNIGTAPQIERFAALVEAEVLAQPESDPAIHYCHRFAILMECVMLGGVDKYWHEAHALLDEYNSARDKWMEAHGQPYVSGFGKD